VANHSISEYEQQKPRMSAAHASNWIFNGHNAPNAMRECIWCSKLSRRELAVDQIGWLQEKPSSNSILGNL